MEEPKRDYKFIRVTEETHTLLLNLKKIFMCDSFDQLLGERLKELLKWGALEQLADFADEVFGSGEKKPWSLRLEQVVSLGIPQALAGHKASED